MHNNGKGGVLSRSLLDPGWTTGVFHYDMTPAATKAHNVPANACLKMFLTISHERKKLLLWIITLLRRSNHGVLPGNTNLHFSGSRVCAQYKFLLIFGNKS